MSTEVSLAVPPDSLNFWRERLGRYGVPMSKLERRFDLSVLPLADPHGLQVALTASSDSLGRPFTPWEDSPIPVEHQIRGLESARLVERDLEPTVSFLTASLGFRKIGEVDGWQRYGLGNGKSGQYLDLRALPSAPRGAWGTGSIHHLAWRVEHEAHQLEVRQSVSSGGAQPTPVIDRFWFKSVYFREPGGVLFELATDGPGFGVDEEMATLGETLVLPPWLEPNRAAIEGVLPKLSRPSFA